MLPWGGMGAAAGCVLAVAGHVGVALWRRRPGRALTTAEAALRAARKQAEADAALELSLKMSAAEARAEEDRLAREEQAASEAAKKKAAEESRRQRAATAANEQQRSREERERQREERERQERDRASDLPDDASVLGDVRLGEMGASYHPGQGEPSTSPDTATGEEVSEDEEGRGGGIRYTALLPPLSPSAAPYATT